MGAREEGEGALGRDQGPRRRAGSPGGQWPSRGKDSCPSSGGQESCKGGGPKVPRAAGGVRSTWQGAIRTKQEGDKKLESKADGCLSVLSMSRCSLN